MAPIFHLYTCNNLTDLAQCYVHHRRQKPDAFMPADLFTPEQVTVPTKGMAVWLEQFLVKNDEIVINLQFPYIRDKVNELLNRHFQNDADFRPELFTPAVMTWRIMAILKQSPADFPALEQYLRPNAGDDDQDIDLRRYQLALRIAQVFDQYVVYKPDMLSLDRWPGDCDWQKSLWKRLCRRDGRRIVSPADKIVAFLQQPHGQMPRDLPPQTVFGVSIMSPVFLNFFKKLSNTTEVHFFYLNPCDEFWADQKSRWAQNNVDEPAGLDEHFENTLLGDFGQQGRSFFGAVLELDHDIDEHTWEPTPAATAGTNDDNVHPTTLLGRVQRAIRTRTTPDPEPLADDDDSITVHNCHHDLRQVEILHDHLLALLKTHHYQFNDILVMAPDIAEYATTIQAVFDQGPLRQGYAIGDRSVKHANRLAESFLSILEIGTSRYELTRLLKLLDTPALRRRFDFSDQDVITLRAWFNTCRIRWGINAENRKDILGVPFDNFSWQHGLDRLLLGLAVEEEDEHDPPLGTIQPLNHADSTENMVLLGNFCGLLNRLRQFADSTNTPQHIAEWQNILGNLLEDFFAADSDSASDYGLMRRSVADLCTTIAQSEYESAAIPFPVIKAALSGAVENTAPYSPFLNGKITFCSLVPMRGIPCKVIAMLGLNEDQFPRSVANLGFNLIAEELESSFRSRQLEDRYLFLEAILSASDKLLFYYRGQDEHRRREYLPSTAVSELLDFARKITAGADLPGALVVKHRLQGFDPHYFRLEKLPPAGFLRRRFSFHSPASRVAAVLTADNPDTLPITAEQLRQSYHRLPTPPELILPHETTLTVTLDELMRFHRNTSRAFLVSRMNFPPPEWDDENLSDFEPFSLNQLEETSLVRRLAITLRQYDELPADYDELTVRLYRDLLHRNLIPIGNLGRNAFQTLLKKAWIEDPDIRHEWNRQTRHALAVTLADVRQDLAEIAPGMAPETHPVIRKLVLTGQVEATADRRASLDCCFSATGGKHLLRNYLRHLFLCAAGGGQNGARLVGRDNIVTLAGTDAASAEYILRTLLACFLVGQRQPLPLFAEYSTDLIRNPNAAAKSFFNSHQQRGDAADPYVSFLWGQDPAALPEHAATLAQACYGNLSTMIID